MIQPRCVAGMRWRWGYCFTRCTNTLVQCVYQVSPRGTGFSFSRMASSHLRQAGRLCHILAHGKLFVWVVNQGSVYLGLLDWRCPLSKWCFSCQRLYKWGLICISLIPPPLPGLFEESYFPPLRRFMPRYRLKPSSLKDSTFLDVQNQSSSSHSMTDGHVFSLFSGLECLIKKAWLGPLMSIWIKSAQWLPGHSPHSNWKPNVHPPHIN